MFSNNQYKPYSERLNLTNFFNIYLFLTSVVKHSQNNKVLSVPLLLDLLSFSFSVLKLMLCLQNTEVRLSIAELLVCAGKAAFSTGHSKQQYWANVRISGVMMNTLDQEPILLCSLPVSTSFDQSLT